MKHLFKNFNVESFFQRIVCVACSASGFYWLMQGYEVIGAAVMIFACVDPDWFEKKN
jgi:hypothetical protein